MRKTLATGITRNIVAALLCMPVAGLASDPQQDGNFWHGYCNSHDHQIKVHCGMFVIGYLSGVQAQSTLSKTPEIYCFPQGAAYLQAVDVFARYLRDNPERRHHHGAVLLTRALTDAFPCK